MSGVSHSHRWQLMRLLAGMRLNAFQQLRTQTLSWPRLDKVSRLSRLLSTIYQIYQRLPVRQCEVGHCCFTCCCKTAMSLAQRQLICSLANSLQGCHLLECCCCSDMVCQHVGYCGAGCCKPTVPGCVACLTAEAVGVDWFACVCIYQQCSCKQSVGASSNLCYLVHVYQGLG